MQNNPQSQNWLLSRVGYMSASSLEKLGKPGAKFGDTALAYIYSIQRQRLTKVPDDQVSSKSMSIGTDNEPYAIDWLRENTDLKVLHCDNDFTEKLFIKVPEIGFGTSPDAIVAPSDYMETENIDFTTLSFEPKQLIEIKCIVGTGAKGKDWMFSPTVSYEKKRAAVFAEHNEQLIGQFISMPTVESIILMKYLPQSDDNEFDYDSPLHERRGLLFTFTREEMGMLINQWYERIKFVNEYIDSWQDIDEIEKARLDSIKNGKMI